MDLGPCELVFDMDLALYMDLGPFKSLFYSAWT